MPKTMGTHDDEARSSRSKRSRQHETVEEVLLPQIHHEFLLWEGCHRDEKSRKGCNGEIDDILRISFTDDELQTKKIIKFRLGGRAHNLTLLDFARRLGLYHPDELEEDGFNVYFEGGYDKIQKNDLWLFIMFDDRHQNGHANVSWVLTEDVVRNLSTSIYCRDLDTITLRDLIDSDGKLIPEDPQPGVPRVGIPRPPIASVQDLYDRIGRMEIRQEAIERMEYRQSYHWDRYQGVFEHMVGVYSVPMQGSYNPPGYAQPQYDQYYQQYPPPPPQYQQQQQDDDE
ncbi:hypothetical protein Tco_0453856 [Tanacetum coccineum]